MNNADTCIYFPAPDASWACVQDRFCVATQRHWESIFTLGSGYLNVRASLPEGLSDDPQNVTFARKAGNVTVEKFHEGKSKWGTFVPGFMEPHPDLNEEVVNLPFPLGVTLIADGEALDMETSKIKDYTRWLDMRDACLRRTCEWHTRSGAVLKVRFLTYVHAELRDCIIQRVDVECVHGQTEITYGAWLDGDVRTNGYDHFSRCLAKGNEDGTADVTATTHNGQQVAVALALWGSQTWEVDRSKRYVSLTRKQTLQVGETLSLNKVVSIVTSLDTPRPRAVARRNVEPVCSVSFELCYNEHADWWREHWEEMVIDIEGDATTTHALRLAQYHLLRAHPRDPRAAICAKMNGGDAYWGRIHWDNEIFIAPFFIYTLPSYAAPLLAYRHHTLPGALARAKELGYPGAAYAWESGTRGDEQCPSFQYADHEIHVTADVVIGMWHYYVATNDTAFFSECLVPVLINVARYWASRVEYYPDDPHGHILCVMGPDEYTHASHDNAYTNYVAAVALTCAAEVCGGEMTPALRALYDAYELTQDEVRSWALHADAITIPCDDSGTLVLQSADFESLLPVDFDTIWPDRSRPLGACISQERLYRIRALKQADVLMLMHLFPTSFSSEEMRAAYAYYTPITTHDSSLSYATHALVATWLGYTEEAWSFFEKTRDLDCDHTAARAAQGIHSANAAALWQCVVFGFLGIVPAYLTETFTLSPRLPSHWKSITLPFCWRGIRMRLTCTSTTLTVHTDTPCTVTVYGHNYTCRPDDDTVIHYTPE